MTAGKPIYAAPEARARFVVTLPSEPSRLAATLARVTPQGMPALTATQEAFTYLARRSKKRLVLITPFIDPHGVVWANDLLQATEASERILVVRDRANLQQYDVSQLMSRVTELLEYYILHPAGTRLKPYETFHAKIVMADGCAAYVGSANLVESSKEVALECGFVIEGPAVVQVADLVEAILLTARSGGQS
jgi:phosphatidylserine/phosphatidylglycerophosphate/cardiolipin synthase-like enzyme